MIPRVFEFVFYQLERLRLQVTYSSKSDLNLNFAKPNEVGGIEADCKCSFVEIYNEQTFDLLDGSTRAKNLREDSKHGVHVENVREIEVISPREALAVRVLRKT